MEYSVTGLLKTLLALLVFIAGALSIVFSQTVGILLSYGLGKEFLETWLSLTKQHFIVLLVTILNLVSKTPIQIRFTSQDRDFIHTRLSQTKGNLSVSLPPNSIMFANHQIYTDWAFLWWFAYTAKMAGFVYIVLKDSLKKIPILGYGMSNYRFIFLSRKWIKDKFTLSHRLAAIDANARGRGDISGVSPFVEDDGHHTYPDGVNNTSTWPYSMIIFPEGTNMSAVTRAKSEAFAAKSGKTPFRHVLLPRSTGLRFMLLKLQNTVNEIYDITLGYSGVRSTDYGQDIYKLDQVFFNGKNPQKIDFNIRVFKIDEIPIGSSLDDPEEAKVFEQWLDKVWAEKDDLMDYYYKHGTFPNAEESVTTILHVKVWEFLSIFMVPVSVYLVFRMVYRLYSIFA